MPSVMTELATHCSADGLASAAATSNHHSGIAAWEGEHTGLSEVAQPKPPPCPRRPCHSAGVCIHQGRGVRIHIMRKRLQAHLRSMFGKCSGLERNLWKNGYIAFAVLPSSTPDGPVGWGGTLLGTLFMLIEC